MNSIPKLSQRRSVRLKDYDYSQSGGYFITICTHQMRCRFGHVDLQGAMHLNNYGDIVMQEWYRMGVHRQATVELDAFVVMPNHVHGIVLIVGDSHQSHSPRANSLGAIVGGFKSAVARRINSLPDKSDAVLWQRSYHDVIIRNEPMLDMLRQYILTNPGRWAEDRYYSDAL